MASPSPANRVGVEAGHPEAPPRSLVPYRNAWPAGPAEMGLEAD